MNENQKMRFMLHTRKCPLCGHILAPPEGLRDPGSTPGFNPRGQDVIPRRFKRKKIFVTNGRTNERTNGRTNRWTDRRVGRNRDLDLIKVWTVVKWNFHGGLFCKFSLCKMASVKINKNKNWPLKTNFSWRETLFLGLKRYLHSALKMQFVYGWD